MVDQDNDITVVMDYNQRGNHIARLLELDGLSHINEDKKAAYCPISLTLTPEILKPYIQERQRILMEGVLKPAGITAYDPGSAPFSPDKDLISDPDKIYAEDSAKIVGARFFVGHNILSSTGQGNEMEKAEKYNRIAVILMDKNIRISRMQSHRAIYLQYNNFEKEYKKFIPVFKMLQQFNSGMGFVNGKPVLIGFDKFDKTVVNLEQEIYDSFPDLKYKYDGKSPIVKFSVENPEIFYESGIKENLDRLVISLAESKKRMDKAVSGLMSQV